MAHLMLLLLLLRRGGRRSIPQTASPQGCSGPAGWSSL